MSTNTVMFSLDANKFAAACVAFNKADGYITKKIAEAHQAGRAALCDIVGALALCTVPFSAALANTIRVTAFRARKAYGSEYTITVSSQGKNFAFDVVKSADIQRKPGAGRKANKAPAQAVADAPSVSDSPARADSKRFADALRALGFGNVELHNIAAGTMNADAVRAFAISKLSPKLPAARKLRNPAHGDSAAALNRAKAILAQRAA